MKTKIVINNCYGGFVLSAEASKILNDKKGWTKDDFENYIEPQYGNTHLPRHDKYLVQVVESLGEVASAGMSELIVEEINGFRYIIDEYDGQESISTPEGMDWTVVDSPEARKEHPEFFL